MQTPKMHGVGSEEPQGASPLPSLPLQPATLPGSAGHQSESMNRIWRDPHPVTPLPPVPVASGSGSICCPG